MTGSNMIIAVLLFIVGLVCLIKGGDWFVDGATGIAKKFNIPDIIIGATVVSIGTTLPEVMVSASSALKGSGQMAFGNAIGSIICNTALVLAITIAFKPSKCDRKPLIVPVTAFFIAALFYAGVAYTTGNFSRPVGIILLLIFVAYMAIVIVNAMKDMKSGKNAKEAVAEPAKEEAEKEKEKPVWLMIVLLIIGAALIAVGARLLVDNGIYIAGELGVPESVIALTFVALGTSLPELVTAITALAKGHASLSLGNVIGANLFNIVLVSGFSVLLGPFSFENAGFSKINVGGHEVFSSLLVDTPLMLIVMLILTIPAIVKQKLSRAQGIILLCLYVGFLVFQFVTAAA